MTRPSTCSGRGPTPTAGHGRWTPFRAPPRPAAPSCSSVPGSTSPATTAPVTRPCCKTRPARSSTRSHPAAPPPRRISRGSRTAQRSGAGSESPSGRARVSSGSSDPGCREVGGGGSAGGEGRRVVGRGIEGERSGDFRAEGGIGSQRAADLGVESETGARIASAGNLPESCRHAQGGRTGAQTQDRRASSSRRDAWTTSS